MGESGPAAPASSDPRWLEDLTLDLTIEMYDCSIDFTTLADNFSMLSQPAGEASVLDGQLFRY